MLRLTTRATGVALAAALISLSAAQAASAAGSGQPASGSVPGELIVRFASSTQASERQDLRDSVDADLERKLLLPNTQVVKVDGPVAAAEQRLEAQDGVMYAEPNYIYAEAAAAPNDARFGDLWGLSNTGQSVNGATGVAGIDVNALSAWDTTRGAGQVIAIVDGGVALAHPDIAANLWTNPGEVVNGVDDDGNLKIDDVNGWDFVENDRIPDDHSTSHGTHVAGIAAGVAGNGIGIAGVAPQAKIMAVAGTGANGSGTSESLGNAIAYAAREGATVINGSFSGTGFSTTMNNAITEARTLGAVVVVAAGNDGANVNGGTPTYPCAYTQPNLICVAALNSNGARASYSNYGATSVDVGAPGTSVLSSVLSFDTVFSDGFANTSHWTFAGAGNSWGLTGPGQPFVSGPTALTDSPAGNYANNTDSIATMVPSLDLTGRSGCRLGFRLRAALEYEYDYLNVRAVAGAEYLVDRGALTGTSSGTGFGTQDLALQVSNADADDFDGSPSVRIRFNLESDTSNVADGVYIDDFDVRCRSPLFDATSYKFFNGTSMASPHVAGVAALVRAANPGLSADAVAARIRATVVPAPALAGLTTTGGRVDAAAAISGQAYQPPVVQPPPVTSPSTPIVTPTPLPIVAPTPVPCAGLKGAKLAECKLTREVVRKCAMLSSKKQATCARKVRALAKCRAMPTKGKKAKAKRAACLKKANKIGTKPKKAKGKRKR